LRGSVSVKIRSLRPYTPLIITDIKMPREAPVFADDVQLPRKISQPPKANVNIVNVPPPQKKRRGRPPKK